MEQCSEYQARASIRDALFVIFSKKRVFLWIFLIIVIGVNLVSFFSRPIYEVSSEILVKPSVDASLQFDSPVGVLRPDPVTQQDINSEIAIILSNELLVKVVEALDLANLREPEGGIEKFWYTLRQARRSVSVMLHLSTETDPVDRAVEDLRDDLDVRPITMSNMIEIHLTGPDKDGITEIVNTLTDLYIDRHIEIHQAAGGESFFNNEADQYAQTLAGAEAALVEFQREWSIIDIAEQRVGNLTTLTNLRQQLAIVTSQAAEMETRVEMSRQDLMAMTQANVENYALAEINRSMLPLLVARERIAALYPENSVEYQDITSQIEEVQARLTEELERIIAGAEIDLLSLQANKAALEQDIAALEAESLMLTEKETELNRLRRELALAEKNYLLYMDKAEEARIENQKSLSRVANVAVASWAHKPSVPIFPKKVLMGVIALVMGAVMGVGGSFLAYYLDHTAKKAEDLQKYADIPVLGSVAIIADK